MSPSLRRTIVFLASVVVLGAGCADSDAATDAGGDPDATTSDAATDAGDPDTGLPDAGQPDATTPDAGAPDTGTPDAGPSCPNGTVDVGEACDDGNTTNGDGCENDCTVTHTCGDDVEEGAEECDDGNNQSGDGCDGLCREEGCGNLRLDVGELCDGTPGCAADCGSVTTCGNGAIDAGEQCDDMNVASWDGCSAACETEKSVAISALTFDDDPPAGCDVTGDGDGDNAIGAMITSAARGFVDEAITSQLAMPPFVVLSVLGAEDPSFTSAPNVRVAWLSATDADASSANDFDGSGTIHVDPATVVGDQPRLSFAGSIAATIADAGPEDVTLPFLEGQTLGLRRAYLVDTDFAVDSAADPDRYSVPSGGGHLCGTLPVTTVAAIPNVLGMLGSLNGATIVSNSCAPSVVPTNAVTMADVFAGGAMAQVTIAGFPIGVPVIVGLGLDVDFDGDGLETLELLRGTGCQAVIVACIDGDGTRIEGHDCVNDAAIQDGWSAAFEFAAANVSFVP